MHTLLALIFLASYLFAAPCIDSLGNGQTCNAKDFTLTNTLINNPPSSCIEGELLTLSVRIGMSSTAKERYDIGMFSAQFGDSAIGGESCEVNALIPLESVNDFNATSGIGPYRDLDNNGCGDALKADGILYRNLTLTNILCQDSDNDGKLDISYALTWQNNTRISCNPNSSADLNPPNASKCLNGDGNLDVIVLPPVQNSSLKIEKNASPSIISEPGAVVTYTVSVENNGTDTLTLIHLFDDKFGYIDGQGDCIVPLILDAGDTFECSFQKEINATSPATHTNTITANAINVNNNDINASDNATVLIIGTVQPNGYIGDLIFEDSNGNGIQDTGESGIDGITVELYMATTPNTLLQSTVTTDGGTYKFNNLSAGNYLVKVPKQIRLYAYQTRNINPHPVTLATNNSSYLLADFGYIKASLSLVKTVDKPLIHIPADTVTYTYTLTNTSYVPLIPRQLYDNRLGDLSDLGCLLPSVLKARESFSCDVSTTLYSLVETNITNSAIAIAIDTQNHHIESHDSADVLVVANNNRVIGHTIWHDKNVNGVVDNNETFFDDITLELNGTSSATTRTKFGGQYAFTNLAADIYTVNVTDEASHLRGYVPTNSNNSYLSDLTTTVVDLNANFGYARASITINKESNVTAIKVPGAAVRFTLNIYNDGEAPLTVHTLYDSVYGDINQSNSNCTLPQILLKGTSYICDFTRDVNASVASLHTNTITLQAADSINNTHIASDNAHIYLLDANISSNVIGRSVYIDTNQNGIKDANESGIPDVTINVTDGTNTIQSTLTNSEGEYLFTLPNGSYFVEVTDDAHHLDTLQLISGTNPFGPFTLNNQFKTDINFGYITKPLITNIVVNKSADYTTIIGSADVTFSIDIENTGTQNVIITQLLDSVFGDIDGMGSCSIGATIVPNGHYNCQFTQLLEVEPLGQHLDYILVTARDSSNHIVYASDSWLIQFLNNALPNHTAPTLSQIFVFVLIITLASLAMRRIYRNKQRLKKIH